MSYSTSTNTKAELQQLNVNQIDSVKDHWISIRYVQAIILFFCLAVNYLMRVNLSIAIVAMTDKETKNAEVYDWSLKEKGVLFSAFFWGYLAMNFCAAVLVTKFNNKYLLLGSVAYSSLATIMSPLVVELGGFDAFVVLRVTIGLMQGFMMSVVTGQLSRWVPPGERARCGSIVLGGMYFGTVISFVTSGILIKTPAGWPSIFYFSGIVSLLWCFVWYLWGAESPNTCKYISKTERDFITSTLLQKSSTSTKKIPWCGIFKSMPCYAVAIASLGQNWGFWILATQMPTFFAAVLDISTTENGVITALPYFIIWIISYPASHIADILIKKRITSITLSRKIFNTLGQWGPALGLLAMSSTNNKQLAIILYTATVASTCFVFMGFNINLLDISPNYAGLLMGITNGFANLSAIFGPLFVGCIVTDESNIESWRTVFFVSSAVFFASNIFFLCFASGEVQEFNNCYGIYHLKAIYNSLISETKSEVSKDEEKPT